MLTLMKRIVVVGLVVVSAAVVSLAQHGGKAEPSRIHFKAGANSATINGRVNGSEEAEYVIEAKKGQRLIIHITSAPDKSSVFDLKAPENADLGLEFDANYNFNKVLPVSGDYSITVVRPTSSSGHSTFKLMVTVK